MAEFLYSICLLVGTWVVSMILFSDHAGCCATPTRFSPRPVNPALLRQVAFLQFLFQETPSVLGHRVVSGACYRHFFLPSLARTC